MKHPSESTLALYAGQELGSFARWLTRRHLDVCPRCRGEVAGFSEMRQQVASPDDDLPGIAWNRLAAEMKANIRVGLAAGECIRESRPERAPLFGGTRLLVAGASIAALLLAGAWLERPTPSLAAGVSLRATGNGIEVREGDRALVLQNGSTQNVTYSAGAQGSMGARYVDQATGYVTINTVYVQ